MSSEIALRSGATYLQTEPSTRIAFSFAMPRVNYDLHELESLLFLVELGGVSTKLEMVP
jgi:hypothetical protein